jgi:hypothetical protein
MVSNQMVGHRQNASSPAALDGYKAAIMAEADRMALEVGRLLREAKQAAPERFERWVADELPFAVDTARRLMAVSEAYETRPAELVARLPKPWQALYALRTIPADVIEEAVESGELSASTTEREAKAYARRWKTGTVEPRSDRNRLHVADHAAGVLMNYRPDDLHPVVRRNLARWLAGTLPESD